MKLQPSVASTFSKNPAPPPCFLHAGLVGIGACVVWFSIQGAGEGSSKITAIIRIFLNYLQGCALLRAMSSQGPPIASRFLETAAVGTVSITSVGAPPPWSRAHQSVRTAVCSLAVCEPRCAKQRSVLPRSVCPTLPVTVPRTLCAVFLLHSTATF